MKEDMKVGFIGAGNMALALAKGLLSSGIVQAENILAADVNADQLKAFEHATSAGAAASNLELVAQADVIVLAVKPQQVVAVLQEVGPVCEERHLVISIAAGITTAMIEKYLRNGVRLIRSMPNTPMLVGAGAVGISRGKWATDADVALAREIFEPAAVVVSVEEPQLDAVTALSGSGPAYFFFLTEAIIQAGIELGLNEEDARTLAVQTAYGAGKLLAETGEAPAELRKRVTSPGGTTEAAINFLTENDAAEIIAKAVKTAACRSRELGENPPVPVQAQSDEA